MTCFLQCLLSIFESIFCGLFVFELTKTGEISVEKAISEKWFWITVFIIIVLFILNISMKIENKSLKKKLQKEAAKGFDEMLQVMRDDYKKGDKENYNNRMEMFIRYAKLTGVKI